MLFSFFIDLLKTSFPFISKTKTSTKSSAVPKGKTTSITSITGFCFKYRLPILVLKEPSQFLIVFTSKIPLPSNTTSKTFSSEININSSFKKTLKGPVPFAMLNEYFLASSDSTFNNMVSDSSIITSKNLEYKLENFELYPSDNATRNVSKGDTFSIESSSKVLVFQITN